MKKIISLGLMLLALACQKVPAGDNTPSVTHASPAISLSAQALEPACQAAWDCCQEFSARVTKGGSSPFNCTVLATQGSAGCEQSLQMFRSLSPRVKAQLPNSCTH